MDTDDLPPRFHPETYLNAVEDRADDAALSAHVDRARRILDAWDDWHLGCTPHVAAAASFYAANFVSRDDDTPAVTVVVPERKRGTPNPQPEYSQLAIRGLFDVSTVSIRNHYRTALRAYAAAHDDATLDDRT